MTRATSPTSRSSPPDDALYAALLREVTAERVRAHFGRFVRGAVERFEVPNVRALNFVLHEALDGGAARSLRSDPLGKSYGSLLLRMRVTLADEEAAAAPRRAVAAGLTRGQILSSTWLRRRSYSTALIWPRWRRPRSPRISLRSSMSGASSAGSVQRRPAAGALELRRPGVPGAQEEHGLERVVRQRVHLGAVRLGGEQLERSCRCDGAPGRCGAGP